MRHPQRCAPVTYPADDLFALQTGSHINDENLEAEYDKELAKQNAQARKLQEVERGMMKQIFPSAEEKRELQ